MVPQHQPAPPLRVVTLPITSTAIGFAEIDERPVAGWSSSRLQYSAMHDSEVQSFVNQIVDLATLLTGASGSAIALRGKQGTICCATSGQGTPPLGTRVDTTSGISKQCLELGIPMCFEDIATNAGVDREIPRAQVRSVAVVPIFQGDDVLGILGVFSNVPSRFSGLHLEWLQQLAAWVGSAENAARAPSQLSDWNDILIENRVPWKRFLESIALHIVVVGALSSLSAIWPTVTPRRPLREARVTHYPVSQSFPAYSNSRTANRSWQYVSADQKIDHKPKPQLRGSTRVFGASDEPKTQELNSSAVDPAFMTSRSRNPRLDPVVLPPLPDLDKAQIHHPHLPTLSVVVPPPEISGRSGLRRINPLRLMVVQPSPEVSGLWMSAELIDRPPARSTYASSGTPSIVPPPPSLSDRRFPTHKRTSSFPSTGTQVIGPPPSIPIGPKQDSATRTISLGGRVSQIVPPPQSIDGMGNIPGSGRTGSLAGAADFQVVPPPPSLEDQGNLAGDAAIASLGPGASQAVPPAPSIPAWSNGNSGTRGTASALFSARSENVLPPSTEDHSNLDIAGVVDRSARPSLPEPVPDLSHRIYQDLELRVVALAWAPPRSSYFSNFEVFIAEKSLSKRESQFIKLVYVFLPYQKRLSEYGLGALKSRRLRVTRDSTCDEDLMQMMWPDENDRANHRSDAPAPTSTDRYGALPCYITTADDYQRAVSKR
jgi:hypothetical protein